MNYETIGIECKSCNKQWRIKIELRGNKFDAFASICECGELIVGNRRKDIVSDNLDDEILIKERYLTNGAFVIITINENDAQNLPILDLD